MDLPARDDVGPCVVKTAYTVTSSIRHGPGQIRAWIPTSAAGIGPRGGRPQHGPMPGSTRHDLVVFGGGIIGGGIIGLAITWWASTEGLRVAVVDPDPGRRAAWATAGMPAPVAEAHVGEEPLAAPNMATVRAWPGYAADRESVSDTPVHFRVDGTLLVAGDRSARAAADLVLAFHRAIGLSAERLGARSCCQAEPLLTPGISGGVDLPDDYRVGTRSAALIQITACRSARVDLAVDEVARLHLTADRVDGAGRHRPAPGRERVPHLRRTVRAPARQLTRYLVPRDDGARCSRPGRACGRGHRRRSGAEERRGPHRAHSQVLGRDGALHRGLTGRRGSPYRSVRGYRGRR